MKRVKTGLDKLAEDNFQKIRGRKIGIVANQTSTTTQLTHIIDEARRRGRCEIKIVFSPEHGFTTSVKDGEKIIGEEYNPEYKVNIYSLYGETYRPPKEKLEEIEILLFDLQDVGTRWYTYISTLYYCIEACGRNHIPLIILDRPNPISGEILEGPILKREYRSFVGIAEIPIRYALTIGELANYFNKEYNLNAEIQLIPMENWSRDQWFRDTGLIWIPSSPNIPTPETAMIYPGTCLIEGTNVSEGRGTTNPFQIIGAPWIKPKKIAEELNKAGLPGVRFRPTIFTPRYQKYARETCGGIQIHITEREEARPFLIGVQILSTIRRLYPERLTWRENNLFCI